MRLRPRAIPILSRCSDRIRPQQVGLSGFLRLRRFPFAPLLCDGKLLAELPRRKDDIFEALIPSLKERPAYRVEVTTAHGSYSYMDSYAFGPALGPLDDYLVREGTHRQLYRRLGAQLIRHEGVDGVLFALWAPNATRVSIVGEFNQWDGRRCQMRRRFDSGLWEIFVPELTVGAVYKFELVGPERGAVAAESGPVRLRG